MQQQIGRHATLLAPGSTANLPPMSILAGISMAEVFPSAIREAEYLLVPKLSHTGLKAELDLGGVTTYLDTEVRAKYAGTGGNGITVQTAMFNALGVLTLSGNASQANAAGVLTLSANFADGDTVLMNGKTYTAQTVLTNVDGHFLIGLTASDSIDNLIAAVVLGAGSGTAYAAATTLHPTMTAAVGAGDIMTATAKTAGTGGNALTTTAVSLTASWGAGVLSGGAAPKTITIGTTVYSLVDYIDSTTAAYTVKRGAAATNTLDNLIAAINEDSGEDTLYGHNTNEHPDVHAWAGAGDTAVIVAKVAGTAGNSIATTETLSNGAFAAVTLLGGTAPADGGVSLTENALAKTVLIMFTLFETTVLEVETLIDSDSSLIEVKTAGTPGNTLEYTEVIAATNLASASDVAVTGVFTLWGLIGTQWMVANKLNGGSAVAGSDPYAAGFNVTDLGIYSRVYLQAASLTGTCGATMYEVEELRT